MMMSMWEVPDSETSDLMQRFYALWLEDHLEKHDALRKAQMEIRSRPGRSSPFYWGAFIIIGK